MNVFAYLRVSSRGQVDGDGYPRQQAAITAFCAKHGLTQTAAYSEKISGTVDDVERPEFSRMLAEIDANPGTVDAVVVERMDRWARRLIVSELLLDKLRERRVKVFSADRGELLDLASAELDPAVIMIRQVLAVVAEFQKSELVLKLRAARERAIARGDYVPGRDPYGSRPGEQVVLKLMLEQRAEGKNFSEIARYMNTLDTRNRSGGVWKPQNVREILLNSSKGKNDPN